MRSNQTLNYGYGRPQEFPWLIVSWANCAISLVLCVTYVILSEMHKQVWNWDMLGISAIVWRASPVSRVPYLLWAAPSMASLLLAVSLLRRVYESRDELKVTRTIIITFASPLVLPSPLVLL
jgi:hypothetical protein